jgi:pimeloyl-ACP methyl ester carboxylesterase
MAALPVTRSRTLCLIGGTVNDQHLSLRGQRKRPALVLRRPAIYDLAVRPWRICHLPLRGAAGRLGTAMAAVLAVAGTISGLTTAPAAAQQTAAQQTAAQRTAARAAAASIQLGSLRLRRCGHGPVTYCGHLAVPLDYASAASPRIRISFRWLPALQHATGTILAVEGGPGFASIGTESDYRAMIGPLLDSRNLLLIDLRGTGTSTPIHCRALQQAGSHQSGARFNRLVGACGRQLNHQWRYRGGGWVHASGDFNTAYSARDADRVLRALRLGQVDLYGDSYGSWFAQTFASRYPARLRSVTLDSTYQVLGLDPWYTTTVITARRAFAAACRLWPACTASAPGSAWARISALARRLATRPVTGKTTTADGTRGQLTVTVVTLVNLINNAGFDPVVYRDLDAAARALLRDRDPAPLLRLAALSLGFDDTNYPFPEFSDGLYFAVACTDYVQLFSRTARPADRARQYLAALRREPARTFAPFTLGQWTALDQYTEAYSGCLHWPAPAHLHPPITRRPPLVPPRLPVLVLSGTLDSLTPRLGGATLVTRQVGRSARLVTLANLTHVAGQDENNGCALSIYRRFVRDPGGLASQDTSCAARITPVHTVGADPRLLASAVPAPAARGNTATPQALRAVTVALASVGDEISRWPLLSGGQDLGLRGGQVSFTPRRVLRIGLRGVRWVTDATVTGTAWWNQRSGWVTARLAVRPAHGAVIRMTARWRPFGSAGQLATVTGTQGGRRLDAAALAP